MRPWIGLTGNLSRCLFVAGSLGVALHNGPYTKIATVVITEAIVDSAIVPYLGSQARSDLRFKIITALVSSTTICPTKALCQEKTRESTISDFVISLFSTSPNNILSRSTCSDEWSRSRVQPLYTIPTFRNAGNRIGYK